ESQRVTGAALTVYEGGVTLEYTGPRNFLTSALIVLVPAGEEFAAVAVEVNAVRRRSGGLVTADGTLGGFADELLQPERLTPTLRPETLRFELGFPAETLDRWVRAGVLRPVWLDRVQVCPRCRALPTFRQGCKSCGSARVGNDRLIHHFACAHVGQARDFAAGPNDLACPKCRARHLVVGADFEYVVGPYRCHDCHWSDTELSPVGHCLRCSLRFPGEQAHEIELKGYHAHRLDALAVRQAP